MEIFELSLSAIVVSAAGAPAARANRELSRSERDYDR